NAASLPRAKSLDDSQLQVSVPNSPKSCWPPVFSSRRHFSTSRSKSDIYDSGYLQLCCSRAGHRRELPPAEPTHATLRSHTIKSRVLGNTSGTKVKRKGATPA